MQKDALVQTQSSLSLFAERTKKIYNLFCAAFFTVTGAIILVFDKNNYKPIYKGLKYFLEHESYKISLRMMKADPKTAELIQTRYNEGQQLDYAMLGALPEDTLGFQFAKFMNNPDVTPIPKLPESKVQISPDIDYLRHRIRVTHDIHHVICGYPADEIGEMAISAYYVAQISSPLNSMLLGLGLIKCTLKTPARMKELMNAITHGWQLGLSTPNIFGIKWEEMWEMPLTEVRKQLNFNVS